MRAVWTGAVTFGLISIPVKLYTAVSDERIDFDLLHEKDGGRIRYRRVCEKEDKEVPWEEIVKGYEIEEGTYVTFTRDELDELDVRSLRSIDIDAFVDRDEIDPIYYERTYYLEPREGGEKAYRLLARTLEDQRRLAVAKFAMRQKEHLCALRVSGRMLVLQTMHWPSEIREPDLDLPDDRVQIRDRELDMAANLVEALASPFEPERYENVFEERVHEAAKRKLEGKEITVSEPEKEPEPVADLMAMLEASLTSARTGRTSGARGSGKGTRAALDDDSDGDGRPHSRQWLLNHTKDELYEMAQDQDVAGRSEMTKAELAEALSE